MPVGKGFQRIFVNVSILNGKTFDEFSETL
jgi:hypothetical protein